jgi:hypothetical protein
MELERRSNVLPNEVEKWIQRTSHQIDFGTHYSQLQAIKIMMDVFFNRQKQIMEGFNSSTEIEDFQFRIFRLFREIIKAQGIWDFFRDKLELRFNPELRDPLAIADTVTFDCYRFALNKAQEFGIITPERFREPPLTYLAVTDSPATYARGTLPWDQDHSLQDIKLPIPVIELPWDHISNLWEYLSLHHEVTHDLEADLKLRPVLTNSLKEKLCEAGISESRITIWLKWEKEIFADLVALLLAGPAFAYSMINTLLLPHQSVISYDDSDSHPSHYIRIFLNSAFVRTLIPENKNISQEADKLDNLWIQLYGKIEKIGNHKVDDFRNDFSIVFRSLIDTKFDILNGHSVRELIPYTITDDKRIRNATIFLTTGQNRSSSSLLSPRHIISASRLALDQIVSQSNDHRSKINDLNNRTAELVKLNTPIGRRAPVTVDIKKHREFIKSLAEEL